MVEEITIDSSVLIAALREQEPKDIGVRGMDAIVIQIAKEFNVPLVSLDTEMLERSKSIIDIRKINDW